MLKFLKEKNILIPIILIICMLVFLGIRLLGKINKSDEQEEIVKSTAETVPEEAIPERLGVHVKGAVVNPGFYEVYKGLRVNDLVIIAGGTTDNADLDGINLAEYAYDSMEVYVPKSGETVAGNPKQLKVNINTASLEQLKILPGIGESYAQEIINTRKNMGGFRKIEDIMNVRGISESRFEQLKNRIMVN